MGEAAGYYRHARLREEGRGSAGYAMLRYAALCCAMLRYAALCCAMLRYAALCYAMLCCAMLCYAMLCYAVLCDAMLCDARPARARWRRYSTREARSCRIIPPPVPHRRSIVSSRRRGAGAILRSGGPRAKRSRHARGSGTRRRWARKVAGGTAARATGALRGA